jgi:hypothetical protein
MLGQWLKQALETRKPVSDENQAFGNRSALELNQLADRFPIEGITAQTVTGFGRVSDDAAAP